MRFIPPISQGTRCILIPEGLGRLAARNPSRLTAAVELLKSAPPRTADRISHDLCRVSDYNTGLRIDEAMAIQFSITLDDVIAAARRIAPYVKRTPLVRSSFLSERLGTNIYLKQEILQKTGAFKVRGAFNKMLTLTDAERRSGVVAVSGGNHAQAVAYAARTLGLKAVICMPQNTPRNYLDATRGYGAEIALVP